MPPDLLRACPPTSSGSGERLFLTRRLFQPATDVDWVVQLQYSAPYNGGARASGVGEAKGSIGSAPATLSQDHAKPAAALACSRRATINRGRAPAR